MKTPDHVQNQNSKYAHMDRSELEMLAYDRLVLSMEHLGEEADVWEEIRREPVESIIAFLEDE